MCLNDIHSERAAKKLKFPTNLIISEGYKYLRILNLDKAISSFETILEQDPNNIKSLLGRAKCFMRLGRYQEAEQDFHQVIKLNPKCTEAIYLKGVTEYLKGDFEKSFISHWEGHKLRPKFDDMRQGYEMSKEAIENSLNAEANVLLTGKDVEKISLLRNKYPITEDNADVVKSYYNKVLFSSDLKLLEDMLKDKNLTFIHSLCKDLFDYLKERQQFWKMQDPFKSRNKLNRTFVKNNAFDLMKMNQLIRNFSFCKTALKEGKTENCIKKGLEVLSVLNSTSADHFHGKNEVKAEILHHLGTAYLVEKDYASALKYCEQQLNIVRNNNVLGGEGRALKDLGEIYLEKNKYKKALEIFTESLRFVHTGYSRAILLYKISDCNVHLNHLENARHAANQCLEFATRADKSRFMFDALLLLAEVAVKGKDMKVAEQHYKKALEIAIKRNDSREKDLKMLLKIFEEVDSKDYNSNERIKILKLSSQIKHRAKSERENWGKNMKFNQKS